VRLTQEQLYLLSQRIKTLIAMREFRHEVEELMRTHPSSLLSNILHGRPDRSKELEELLKKEEQMQIHYQKLLLVR